MSRAKRGFWVITVDTPRVATMCRCRRMRASARRRAAARLTRAQDIDFAGVATFEERVLVTGAGDAFE